MATTRCPHHWLIETAVGPVSKGVCRLCGEERAFDNSPNELNHWAELARQKRLEKRSTFLAAHTEEQP